MKEMSAKSWKAAKVSSKQVTDCRLRESEGIMQGCCMYCSGQFYGAPCRGTQTG